MSFLKKIIKKKKTGLAALIASTIIGITSYTHNINNNSWPLPNETKFFKAREEIQEIICNYKGKKLKVNIKIEIYGRQELNFEDENKSIIQIYAKHSFKGEVFAYTIMEPAPRGDAYRMTVLMDRDRNGSFETKYSSFEKDTGNLEKGLSLKKYEELEKDREIPNWILDELS